MSSTPRLSRRDLLKLAALASAGLAARPLASLLERQPQSDAPNVLIFVFDAWSARNMQLFGYPRQTMPNFERIAARSTVYHNHYSTASFTVPGTASLLTSLYPWTHRAVQLSAGGVTHPHADHNIFKVFEPTHSNMGYAQNPYADTFLFQFQKSLDTHTSRDKFDLEVRNPASLPLFQNDARLAFAGFENNVLRSGKGEAGSLFLSTILRLVTLNRYGNLHREYLPAYPKGPPIAGGVFLLDELLNGTLQMLERIQPPTLGYFHLFPPHEPYAPTREFAGHFKDGWTPPEKPFHPLSRTRAPFSECVYNRLAYDQYLASWDAEVTRLLDFLETSGLFDSSIIVFTSDHGELFERGEIGHSTLVLSDPVVRVPLFISVPGQTQRRDVYSYTSSVDLLPTLAHLASVGPVAWTEGQILPALGGPDDPNRSIYSLDAKMASSFSTFNQYSIALMRQGHRLIHYQYPEYSGFEFYDMENDPEEMNDLSPSTPALMQDMKKELLQKVEDFNRPYRK